MTSPTCCISPHGRVRLEGAYLGGGFGGKEDVTVECLLGLLVWKTRPPGAARFLARRVVHRSRQAASVRDPLSDGRRAGWRARRARGRADLRLRRLRGALAVGPALQPGDLDRALPDPQRQGGRDGPSTRTIPSRAPTALRLHPDLPGLRGPDGCARRGALTWIRWRSASSNFLRKGTSSRPARCSSPSRCWPRRCAAHGRALARPAARLGPTRVGRASPPRFSPYGRMCWTRDSASAWVGMELDGTAVVRCAAPDVGGGQTSSLCSIIAEVLGLAPDHVTASAGIATSLRAPARPPPRASSDVGQRGAQGGRECAASGRRRPRCSGGRPGDIDLAGGRHSSAARRIAASDGERREGRHGDGRPVQVLEKYDAPSAPTIDPATGQGKAFNDYTFGTHALEVEIDDETGRTRPTRLRPASTPAASSIARTPKASSRAAWSRGSATRSWKRSPSRTASARTPTSPTTRSRPRSTRRRSRRSCWNPAKGSARSAPRAWASRP